MYIPKHFQPRNEAEVFAFLQAYSFATIVTVRDKLPAATHLPFTVSQQNGKIVLGAHFARANPQWEDLGNQRVLVIFSEPHAYISPKHYDREESVPTWNYISVHAYGMASLVTDPDRTLFMLQEMINQYEPGYMQQWEALSREFKHKMLKGIVAFEILVDDLQAVEKLSQNKSGAEQKRIVESLAASPQEMENKIAAYMLRNLK